MQRELQKCSALPKGSSGRRENIVARHPSIQPKCNVVHHAATQNLTKLRAKRLLHSERASKPKQNYETEPIPSFVFNKYPKRKPISRQTYLWAAVR
jgi:hypothetical protein